MEFEKNFKDLKNFKQLKIYLTGYGPFMSITENPSQLLVDSISKIKDKITEKFKNKITFEVIQIMDVDCDFVEAAVKKMHETIFSDQDIYTMKLVINVGVNGMISEPLINLESIAKNYIDDRKSRVGKIIDSPIKEIHAKLDVNTIESFMGNSAKISLDAGDYLCNFTFFLNSFAFMHKEDCYNEFLHIPMTNVLDTPTAVKIFLEFITTVYKLYIK